MKAKTALILGATGAIGQEIARELKEHGYYVIVTGRKLEKLEKRYKEGFEKQVLNVMNAEELEKVTKDIDYVFNCINPPYTKWDKYWPPIIKNIIKAMKRNKFKLIYTDNVYSFGRIRGNSLKLSQPMKPVGKKGKVKKQVIKELQREREIWENTVIIHYPDFFGPTVNNGFFENLIIYPMKGKTPLWLFNDNVPHSFIFTRDAARAAVTIAAKPEAYGKQWIVSSDEPITGKEFFELVYSILDKKPKYRVFKKWQIRLIGLFVPIVKELLENEYQWNEPFILDTTEFTSAFPEFKFTTMKDAIQITINELKLSLENLT